LTTVILTVNKEIIIIIKMQYRSSYVKIFTSKKFHNN